MRYVDLPTVKPMPKFDMSACRDFNGDLVTIFNYDRRAEGNTDPFSADEPDMTGVSE